MNFVIIDNKGFIVEQGELVSADKIAELFARDDIEFDAAEANGPVYGETEVDFTFFTKD